MESEMELLETVSPVTAAKEAGLRYVTDRIPGIQRVKRGKHYVYLNTSGEKITDEKILNRITALRIPHVWRDVWICPAATGHLQAVGYDEKNRKQYRYHAKWEKSRNETKFTKMKAFGEALPALRERLERDLRKPAFSRDRMLATVVSLLDHTLIRVGNKQYEQTNQSYGLTTLRNKHVKEEGSTVKIVFSGKKNVCQEIVLTDRRLKKIVKKCKELPGYQLFQYVDEDGDRQPVDSSDVNDYLREVTGMDLSAKDFRTWGGSAYAVRLLMDEPAPADEKTIRQKTVDTIKGVAAKLGNTVAVCRKYYVHPIILDRFADGTLAKIVQSSLPVENPRMHAEEDIFLRLLATSAA